VMTTSGTATLEISLLEIPMVISYRLLAFTYLIGRFLVNTKFIGLPNIIAGKSIVKELIQHEATAANLAKEINHILQDKAYYQQMLLDLAEVKKRLGQGGGSKNMAELALQLLKI